MNADETQVGNTYLGFFTIFSSFLCSASLEKKDKSFRGHFPGSCVPYFHIFWPKRNIERGWGTGGKNRTCPPPHTHIHLPVAFSSETHLFCGCSSPPGPVTPAHSFQCWMIMLSATVFSRLSSYTLVIFSSFSYI